MKKRNSIIWEIVCYVCLALCIFGQITVGKMYLVAQGAYLVANIGSVVRDFAIHLPVGNKVKDTVFCAISAGLIMMRIF